MPSLSPDTILIAALVLLVCIIAIVVIRILLSVQALVKQGETRTDYLYEEQARLALLHEERRGLMKALEREHSEQYPQEEPEGPESPPVARVQPKQGQNLEIDRRAEKLERDLLQLKQDHRQLAEDLEQVREQQREADRERERIVQGLRDIKQILNGRLSSPR